MRPCTYCDKPVSGGPADALSIDNDGRVFCARCGDDHARLLSEWAPRGQDYEKEDARR